MSTTALLGGYGLIGISGAALVWRQQIRIGALQGWQLASLVWVLWPFLLPALLLVAPSSSAPPAPVGPRAVELRARERAVLGALQRLGGGALPDTRAQAALGGLLEQLVASDRRLAELERDIEAAPTTLRDQLNGLRDCREKKLEQGLQLLDELHAKLTLLYFAADDPALADADAGDAVAELIMQIEALTELSAS